MNSSIPNGNGEDVLRLIPLSQPRREAGNDNTAEEKMTFRDLPESDIIVPDSFKEAFGYSKNTKKSDLERAWFVKPIFIVDRGITIPSNYQKQPEEVQQVKQMLFALVADQDYLFFDADDNFRTSNIYKAFCSTAKKVHNARVVDKQDVINEEIEVAIARSNRFLEESDQRSAMLVLRMLVDDVSRQRRSLSQWLYSKSHLIRPNCEAPNSPWQLDLLDYDKVKKDILTIASDKEKNDVEKNDIERVWAFQNGDSILTCLAEYIQIVQQDNLKYDGFSKSCDPERLEREWPKYQNRYKALCSLATLSQESCTSISEIEKIIRLQQFSQKKPDPKSRKLREIYDAVQSLSEGHDLHIGINAGLKSYIMWVLDLGTGKLETCYKPILVLTVVLALAFDYSNIGVVLRPDIIRSWFRKSKYHKEKHRFAQVEFLDKLHNIFELDTDAQAKSWNLFFQCQEGPWIQSVEEAQFWRDYISHVSEPCKLFPSICFQLYFINCCESCMPAHYERLSVVLPRDKESSEFFSSNSNVIGKTSVALSKTDSEELTNLIEEYCQLWKSPEADNEARRQPIYQIDSILASNNKVTALEEYNNAVAALEELQSQNQRLLLIEAAVRKLKREQAKKKIYGWFDKLFYFDIGKAVYNHI